MMRFVPVLAAALIAAGSASANESGQQEEPKKEAKEKLVCKSEAVTGYRARRVRTCMTQSEWDSLAAGSRRAADEYVEDLNRTPPPPG